MTPAMTPVSPFKLASVLLQYPTAALFDGLSQLDAVAAKGPRASREPFGRFLAWLAATPPPRSHSTTWRPSTCAAAARYT